jgi:hypothetical protein
LRVSSSTFAHLGLHYALHLGFRMCEAGSLELDGGSIKPDRIQNVLRISWHLVFWAYFLIIHQSLSRLQGAKPTFLKNQDLKAKVSIPTPSKVRRLYSAFSVSHTRTLYSQSKLLFSKHFIVYHSFKPATNIYAHGACSPIKPLNQSQSPGLTSLLSFKHLNLGFTDTMPSHTGHRFILFVPGHCPHSDRIVSKCPHAHVTVKMPHILK